MHKPAFRATAVFLAAAFVIFLRRPDAFLLPQFYAEDGRVWYAEAYNSGWLSALLQPQDGYFQTLPRLAAALSLAGPLTLAPAVMNAVGLLFQVMPVLLLLSTICDRWGSRRFRAMLAAIYLLLPNSSELNISVTESQWRLAFSAFLIVVGKWPSARLGQAFCAGAIVLCGLTGPFCFVLLPVAAVVWFSRRERWLLPAGAILGLCCAVQMYSLCVLASGARADGGALGASPQWLVRILAGQIYLATLVGTNVLAYQLPLIVLLSIAVGFTLLVCAAWLLGGFELRCLVVFAAVLFFAALANPVVKGLNGHTKWQILASVSGVHYWFFPTLAFAWCVAAYAVKLGSLERTRIASAALVALLSVGILRDFRMPAYVDFKASRHARVFEASPHGTVMTIPENPPGWTFTLVKR